MTTTARLSALATLPFTALYALITALFCPVTIGVATHLIFAPDSMSRSAIIVICFTWGAIRLWAWWTDLQHAITALTRRPRRLRVQW